MGIQDAPSSIKEPFAAVPAIADSFRSIGWLGIVRSNISFVKEIISSGKPLKPAEEEAHLYGNLIPKGGC
jgi:hypothetical protein